MVHSLHDIFDELKKNNAVLVTAESLTGGLIAERITAVPGASEVFWGGWVTYSEQAKQQMIGVPQTVLQQFGAVSCQTAAAMAEGALTTLTGRIHSPCYALAVTGLAGPSGGTEAVPVGTVCIACAGNAGTLTVDTKKCVFAGTRAEIRDQTYNAAMDMLMQLLDKIKNKGIQ
ncbi:MAG: CinA family protein [Treponema sp.]